jgi:peroxiredoxin Q/BCP
MRTLLTAAVAAALLAGTAAAAPTVKEGDKFPDIELPATQIEKVLPEKKDAKTIKISDFAGKKNVVLFFYPKALTGGCTVESCGFRDKLEKFAPIDTVILGISTDTLELQGKFTEKNNLNFPLLADTDKKVTEQLGILIPDRKVAQRVTFVIDKKGFVRKVYEKVVPKDHPQEVYTFIEKNLK